MKRLTLLTFLLMGLLTAQVDAATYFVATTGNDGNVGSSGSPWRTLLHAAQTMVAGDTTIVKNGTYVEAEVPFLRSGTPSARITLQAENQYLAILSSISGCNPNISLYGSYITIDGLRIRVDAADVNCATGPTSASGTGVRAWPSNNPHKGGNESSGFIGAWIKNNWVEGSSHRSHCIKTNQDTSLIENNLCYSGIDSFNNNGTIIRGNSILAPDGFGHLFYMKGGTRNNQFYNNRIDFSTSNGGGVMIGGCTNQTDSFDTSTRIENYNAAVYNNVVTNSNGNQNNTAFWFRSDSNSTVFNNVTVNLVPVLMTTTCATSPTPSNVNPTFVNNIAIGNGSTTIPSLTTFTGTKNIDHNNFYNFTSGVPTQAHAVIGNPNLVNNASDWHPQAGSPAIGSGTTLAPIAFNGQVLMTNITDMDGKLRTVPWDLGIYATNGGAGDTIPPIAPLNVRIQ